MKFIGQHIWDYISRFRNDVYLESIADGTVANDKFLGLDSNNKIVKEAVSAGDANQTITFNSSDSSPSGFTALQFNTSNVNLTFEAGEGIDLSASLSPNAKITIAGEDASTSNKGIAEFSDNDFSVGSGKVNLADTIVGGKVLQGNLRIGGSGDTANNWITIDAQNGDDASGGGICFYETGTDTVGAPEFGAKIVYNEDDDELAIGTMHSGVFLRQIHMDRGTQSVRMQNAVLASTSTDGPFLMLQNDDTSVVDGQSLCRILVRNADRGTGTTTSQIQWVATEDHDSNSGGTKINFTVTPNGNSQSETTAMTINQDSSISIPGTIELGHESDTTIARSAAGTVTIEGNQVVVDGVNDPGSGQNGPIATKIARRTLTTAECNDLHNTPIEIIPAQGANSIILITGGMIRVDRAANQTNASCDFNLHFDGKEPGAFGSSSIAHFRRFHNGATTDGIYNIAGGIFSGRYATTLTEDINKAVEVSFDAAATTDCFTSIDIYLTYCVITQ